MINNLELDKRTQFIDEILEAKLELLHKCLTPESIPEKLPAILINAHEAERKFRELKTKSDGPFGENYNHALTQLRNALLDNNG
jgi:hypothetical protein